MAVETDADATDKKVRRSECHDHEPESFASQQPPPSTTTESQRAHPPFSSHAEEVSAPCCGEAVSLGAIIEPSEAPTQPASEGVDGVEDKDILVTPAAAVVPPLEAHDDSLVHQHSPSTETSAQAAMTYASNYSMGDCSQNYAESPTSAAGPCSLEPSSKGSALHPSPSPLHADAGIAAVVTSGSSSIHPKESQDSILSDASSFLESLLESTVAGEESTSIAHSEAGDSKCTSNSPAINGIGSGGDTLNEKLVALGAYAKAKGAGEASHRAAQGGAASSAEEQAIKTAIATRSASPVAGTAAPAEGERETPSPLPVSPSSAYGVASGYDKKRLTERLRQRLAKRNQLLQHARASGVSDGSPARKAEAAEGPSARGGREAAGRSRWETRLQAASRQRRRSQSRTKSAGSDADSAATPGLLPKHSRSSEADEGLPCPDTVTFSDGEGEAAPALRVDTRRSPQRYGYRKAASEVGVPLSQSTRSYRAKGRPGLPHHHGIGILQADGIVYDDALLLRLARQARHGRLRGDACAGAADADTEARGGERRCNSVKIHVYDLLTKDALVEMPYFNCNFPIGECFKVINDGCHNLGTGAYHVGVEVNGVEYAFGANSITGLSGIFTCAPKESPGYEYREELDFGKLYTTKRTWIRVPKVGTGASFRTISEALGGSVDVAEEGAGAWGARRPSPKASSNDLYSFREVETFADGHTTIHAMAREYMGTDYDLLRKNCCSFARDVCIRLGVKEADIPRWFHNAAQAGADAEDAITNVEYSVRNMLDCTAPVDPLDLESYNHGFEIILPMGRTLEGKMTKGLKVVESPTMRTPQERTPLDDDNLSLSDMHETASWTY